MRENESRNTAAALVDARVALGSVFGSFFPRMPVVALVVDDAMRLVSLEGGALETLGIGEEAVPGTPVVPLLTSVGALGIEPLLAGALRGIGSRRLVSVRERVLDVSVEPLKDERRLIQGAIALALDITAERNARRAVTRLEANLVRAQRLAQLGWWHYDIERGLVTVSDEMRRLYDLPPAEIHLSYDHLLTRVHPEDRERVHASLIVAENEGIACRGLDYRIIGADGGCSWVVQQTEVTCVEGKPVEIHGAVLDVTDRKVLEEHWRRLAHVDMLSGLANRTKLTERLDDAFFAQPQIARVALIFIDIDAFKAVNDTFGHGAGDGLLQDMAQRISECVRPVDFVARSGGDEFVVLVEMPDRDAVAALADRIVKNCARPFAVGGEIFSSSISLGVSMAPEDASSPAELLRNADLAMYAAKKTGGNTYRFFAMHVPSVEAPVG